MYISLYHSELWPAGVVRGKVRGSPKSVGFIVNVCTKCLSIYPIFVENLLVDQLTGIVIHRVIRLLWLKTKKYNN